MSNSLPTNLKKDILMASQNGRRTFDIIDKDGKVIYSGVSLVDRSKYLQKGDEYDNDTINEQNEVINSNTECYEIVNNRTRTNLIKFPYYQSGGTIRGITFTVNADGTITVNGTATANSYLNLTDATTPAETHWPLLKAGTYKILGESNDTNVKIRIQLDSTSGVQYREQIFTIDSDRHYKIYVSIPSGATVNNVVIKPMLTTDLNATYDDYVRYTGDGELNEDVAKLQELVPQVSGLNDLIQRLDGEIITNTNSLQITNTLGDAEIVGGLKSTTDNPYIELNADDNNCGIYFDGTDFYATGQKAGADSVTKKLGNTVHTATKTINSVGSTDLGATHDYRYVETSGLMVVPTATKSITANGSNIDVKDYAKVNVNVSSAPVLLGTYNNPGTTYNTSVGTQANPWTINVTSLLSAQGVNYKNVTSANFLFVPTQTHIGAAVNGNLYPDKDVNVSISYNATSGIVTINNWANIVTAPSWTFMGYIKQLKLYFIR